MGLKSLFIPSAIVVLISCGTSARQGTIARQLLPSELVAEPARKADHFLRIRVYAGADYRARVTDWSKEIRIVLEQSSAILSNGCGVGLQLVDTPIWKRSGGKLDHTLKTLMAQDPGLDVDLVIGLIDAPKAVELTMDQLVRSTLLGKHLVLRSYNRQAAHRHLDLAGADLSEAQQDLVLDKRRRHKQTVVLTHGIARLLGARQGDAHSIDGEVYDLRQTGLSESAAAIVAITAKAYLAKKNIPAAWEKAIVAYQESAFAESGKFSDQLVAQMRTRSKAIPSSDALAERSTIRESDRDSMITAKRLSGSGRAEEAWVALEPLVELYPQEASIADLACLVAQQRGAADALAHCQLATRLHVDHAENWISLAELRVETSPSVAKDNLQQATKLLVATDSASWLRVALASRALSMPQHAEHAAASVKDTVARNVIVVWAREMRLRYGVHVGVTKDEEGEYLKELKDGLRQVYKKDYSSADKIAKRMRAKYPDSVAGPLLQCEIALRRRKYSRALLACKNVLARQKTNSWAMYLQGVILVRKGQVQPGIASLQMAIHSDPQLKAAYLALAKVYSKPKDERLEPLGLQYQSQFGEVLPK